MGKKKGYKEASGTALCTATSKANKFIILTYLWSQTRTGGRQWPTPGEELVIVASPNFGEQKLKYVRKGSTEQLNGAFCASESQRNMKASFLTSSNSLPPSPTLPPEPTWHSEMCSRKDDEARAVLTKQFPGSSLNFRWLVRTITIKQCAHTSRQSRSSIK